MQIEGRAQAMAGNASIVTLLLLHAWAWFGSHADEQKVKLRALLVFGDSTVDPGNNNLVPTQVKANHAPYGINFPLQVATGRFCDGKLATDFVASAFHLKETIPAFLDPNLTDDDVPTGVSFASAGSGFDDLTSLMSHSIPVSQQPEYFKQYLTRLQRIVGPSEASTIISGALVVISAGANDFMFNLYDLPTPPLMTVAGYQDYILDKLHVLIQEIYGLGGRKFVVAGLPPIGCIPKQREGSLLRACQENQNSDAQAYNVKLQDLLNKTEASLPGSRLVYTDIYQPLKDLIDNPQRSGFIEATRGCCGSGLNEEGLLCGPLTPICPDPTRYVYWDAVHASQRVYQMLAQHFVETLGPIFNFG